MVSGKGGVARVAVSALFSHCISLRSASATSARALSTAPAAASSTTSGAVSLPCGRMSSPGIAGAMRAPPAPLSRSAQACEM